PGLRVGGLFTAADSRTTELGLVGRRGGHVDGGAINGEQPLASQPRISPVVSSQRLRAPPERRFNRAGAQASSGLEDRRCRRGWVLVFPPRCPGQSIDEISEDILIAPISTESPRDREACHHPSRQHT